MKTILALLPLFVLCISAQTNYIAFGDAHVKPIVAQLLDGKYPLKDIQDRFNLHRKTIEGKYESFRITFSTNSHPKSPQIVAASHIQTNLARIFLVTPHIYKEYLGLTNDVRGMEKFESMLVCSIMHEFDHVAMGMIGVVGSYLSPETKMEYECKTWAATLEHTIAPLTEKYKRALHQSDQRLYNFWIRCNRGSDSKMFKEGIEDLYQTVHK